LVVATGCGSTRFAGVSADQARTKAQRAVAAHFISGPPPFRFDHAIRGSDVRDRPAWIVYFKRTAGSGPGCSVYVRSDEARTTPLSHSYGTRPSGDIRERWPKASSAFPVAPRRRCLRIWGPCFCEDLPARRDEHAVELPRREPSRFHRDNEAGVLEPRRHLAAGHRRLRQPSDDER